MYWVLLVNKGLPLTGKFVLDWVILLISHVLGYFYLSSNKVQELEFLIRIF